MPGAIPLDDGFVTGVRAVWRAGRRALRRAGLAVRGAAGRLRRDVFVVFFLAAMRGGH
jgi:hypothetical protein